MSTTLNSSAESATSSTGSRICKKVVVQGHASSTGTLYTLYLKVHLPTNEPCRTYDLFTDPTIDVRNAIVHRLDASGAAPALSDTAAIAAKFLGIPISIGHSLDDSLLEFDPRKRRTSGSQSLPLVSKASDGKLLLQNTDQLGPRSKQGSASSHGGDSYMITLELYAPATSKPPFAPFSVRLAVPFCLRNYVRLTVDIDINNDLGAGDIIVESDPGIRRGSKRRRKSSRSRTSTRSSLRALSSVSHSDDDDDADSTLIASDSAEDSGPESDDFTIVGSFDACDALVIRLAGAQAGDLLLPAGSSYQTFPNALRAKQAISAITYRLDAPDTFKTLATESTDVEARGAISVPFETSLELHDPFFAGLDREVQLYMLLDSHMPIVKWQPNSVDASRGILSWFLGQPTLSSPPSTAELGSSSDAKSGRSLKFDSADLLVLPDPALRSDDDEDLLSTAPPDGINDANFDFSLDTVAAPPAKQRRFSLQSASSAKGFPSGPPSEPSDSTSNTSHMLNVLFNLLPVLQSTEPIVLTVRGILALTGAAADALRCRDTSKLPKGLFVPAALAQEYRQPTIVSAEAISPQSQLVFQPAESLQDSRETVQEKRPLVNAGMIADQASQRFLGDAHTEDILRQALAIITAHNASLAEAKDKTNPEHTHPTPREERSRSEWILLISHLLWTLFLTATMVTLFSAGQNANHALSVKLDQLTKKIEAASLANFQHSEPLFEPQRVVTDVVEPVFQSLPDQSPGLVVSFDQQEHNPGLDDKPDSKILDSNDRTAVKQTAFKGRSEDEDMLRSSDDQVQLEINHQDSWQSSLGVMPYVYNWITELLELPVVLLTRFIHFLAGHR